MSNRNFNKQVTQSRKPLAAGGPIPKITKAKAEKYADAENRSKVRIKKKEVEGLK